MNESNPQYWNEKVVGSVGLVTLWPLVNSWVMFPKLKVLTRATVLTRTNRVIFCPLSSFWVDTPACSVAGFKPDRRVWKWTWMLVRHLLLFLNVPDLDPGEKLGWIFSFVTTQCLIKLCFWMSLSTMKCNDQRMSYEIIQIQIYSSGGL